MLQVVISCLIASLITPSALHSAQQVTAQDLDQVLKKADGLLELAKNSYESARSKNSVQAFTEASFTLEEARIKLMVIQELGAPELQKAATDRLRSINQLAKLIHDGKVAISGKSVGDPEKTTPAADPQPQTAKPPLPPSVPVTARLQVPDPAKQKEAEKQIRDLYKDQYAKKMAADRAALAKELLSQASSSTDPGRLWVLLREAQDLAAQVPDIGLCVQSADRAAALFDVDPMVTKLAALGAAAKNAKSPDDFMGLTVEYDRLTAQFLEADDYSQAEKSAATAAQWARRTTDTTTISRVNFHVKEVAEAKVKFELMKNSLQALARNPDDPAANLEIGLFICFIKGNWDLGLRFLIKGADPGVKTAAEKDLTMPTQVTDQIAIGDSWWDLGEKEKNAVRKDRLQERARSWYQAALPQAPPLLRSRLEKRIDPTTDAPVDLLKLIDAKADFVAGEWATTGKALVSGKVLWSRIQVPYAPPEEYDLAVVAERLDGKNALLLGLARPSGQVALTLDGWFSTQNGLSLVDGKWANENETKTPGSILKIGRPVAVVCQVRKEGISVLVDGKKILDWKGNSNRLSNPPELAMPNSSSLYVAAQETKFAITKMVLTPINSGVGRKLR